MADLLRETKEILRSLGARPEKRRGQNFMIDPLALAAIADTAAAGEAPLVTLEIGPGLGFLTRELISRRLRVIAIEKDRVFAGYLAKRFQEPLLRVLEKDILRVSLKEDLGLRGPIAVAANIPYNITSPVLEWLIDQRTTISRAVLTMQWEVARRLQAVPGTKEWGSLSLFIQTYAEVRLIRKIPKRSFFPAPKVDSAAVELIFSKKPRFSIGDEALFFKLVRRAFQKRRKTALNSLAESGDGPLSKNNLTESFRRAELDPRRRSETFTIPEWAKLTECMLYSSS